jgi:hypothetical protein
MPLRFGTTNTARKLNGAAKEKFEELSARKPQPKKSPIIEITDHLLVGRGASEEWRNKYGSASAKGVYAIRVSARGPGCPALAADPERP